MRSIFLFSFLLFVSPVAFCQTEITRQDSGKCYSMCEAPMIYRFDTIPAVSSPRHKIIVLMPQSFLVSTDTIQYASGDSAWVSVPGIFDVTEEKIAVGNGKSKTITKYIVLQQPKHEFTRSSKKFKQVTIYETADLPSKKKVEFPATYTFVALKKLVNPDAKQIETEVLCSDKLTEKIIQEVQLRLKGLGFETDNFSNELGETTLDALKKLQQQNELPIGGLNIPTLQYLGIQY